MQYMTHLHRPLLTVLTLAFISLPATAQINLKNGADINMVGSNGSSIIFPDGTSINSAKNGINTTTSGTNSTVGGGSTNTATGIQSTVAGGKNNLASGTSATVSGGVDNSATAPASSIGGGEGNIIFDNHGTIAGGYYNEVGFDDSDTELDPYATVGGGRENFAEAGLSTIGGGWFNYTAGIFATIAGGGPSNTNDALNTYNYVFDDYGTIGGGGGNVAGFCATTPGGANNTAAGDYSFVAGLLGNDQGFNNAFVWGGASGNRTAAGHNTFNVWSTGIYLNGVVKVSSDKNLKENFTKIDPQDILAKVAAMPITTWKFKTEDDSTIHIGPVAQDFRSTFGFGGDDDTHITSTDADGVALAAIQGLNQKLTQELGIKQTAINTLKSTLNEYQKQLSSLESRLNALENTHHQRID